MFMSTGSEGNKKGNKSDDPGEQKHKKKTYSFTAQSFPVIDTTLRCLNRHRLERKKKNEVEKHFVNLPV